MPRDNLIDGSFKIKHSLYYKMVYLFQVLILGLVLMSNLAKSMALWKFISMVCGDVSVRITGGKKKQMLPANNWAT